MNLTTNCCKKTGLTVATPLAKRGSELHDLMSSHHRVDAKCVHIPVGDI